MKKPFEQRIAAMNAMYRLPANERPTLPANLVERLVGFKATLLDEVHEIDEIVALSKNGGAAIDIAVALADLLGDIMVYCRSEALKYGLPLEEVLDVIMDSNESKLDPAGNPIYDANGKFLKGPNYWKPEPRIKALLEARGIEGAPVRNSSSQG
jgi:NTP pyrophosphatase (non-canonical NTP hydrolase)